MKTIILKYFFLIVILLNPILFFTCTDYKEPGPIEPKEPDYSPSPSIASVLPGDSAAAGVREIVLLGQNFNVDGTDTNWVFVGNQPALIKSISADRIVIYRPTVFGELDLKVVIPSAVSLGRISDYKIEQPVESYGDFRFQAYPLHDIEIDNQENLYVATRREILKLAPNGIDLTTFAGDLSSDFAEITDMKFGPEGYLYALTGDRELYRFHPQTGNLETYLQLPNRADKLDFDINKNIYVGRRDGLFVVKTDKSVTNTGHYEDIPAVEIRVFNNELYWASSKSISKNQILDNNGSVGEDQTVLDLNKVAGFENFDISSFNISSEGIIYLCIKRHPQYSIFVLENDGSLTPFYRADILPQRVDQIIWGSSRYIYLNRGSLSRDSVRVYKMGMDKLGAPYLGRQN